MLDQTDIADFRISFVREPSALKHYPALVLNADFRPLSYYPLSLWPWQEAIKAWARLLPERDELERQLAHIARAQIDVGVGVVGAVDASFGKKVVRLRKPYDKGCFSVVEERVVHTDPGGNLTPAG